MTTFPHRCAAALTHPLTVAALFTLLFNDLVLKSLWPGWVTGKLSDLAWVVFAPPLIAFALCRLTRGNLPAERGVFAVAYIGLPLLYAAFNTFEPLHDWILSGLLFLSGGTVGSPWDPTDSIVIPLGFALTLWIWRQSGARPADLRARLSLYLVVVASLATLATSDGEPSPTRWHAGVAADGSVIVETTSYDYYQSYDGGLTWSEPSANPWFDIAWGGQSVETPRGAYEVREFGITLAAPEAPLTTVFSTEHLREGSNLWALKFGTRHLRGFGTGVGGDSPLLTAPAPINIVYDERTANVVVTMGLQGVVIGGPDGTWTRVAVGEYSPIDFSFWAKQRLLFSGYFWLAVFAIALSFLALALALSGSAMAPWAGPPFRSAHWWVTGTLLASLVVLASIAFSEVHYEVASNAFRGALIALPLSLAAFAWAWPRQHAGRGFMTALFAVAGALVTFFFFSPYGSHLDDFAIVGLASSILAVVMSPPQRDQLGAFTVALAAMLACIVLPLLLWLAGGINLALATTAMVLLLIATGLLFRWHLLRQAEARDTHLATTPPPPAPPQ